MLADSPKSYTGLRKVFSAYMAVVLFMATYER